MGSHGGAYMKRWLARLGGVSQAVLQRRDLLQRGIEGGHPHRAHLQCTAAGSDTNMRMQESTHDGECTRLQCVAHAPRGAPHIIPACASAVSCSERHGKQWHSSWQQCAADDTNSGAEWAESAHVRTAGIVHLLGQLMSGLRAGLPRRLKFAAMQRRAAPSSSASSSEARVRGFGY